MGLVHIMSRSGESEVRRFKEGLRMAKEGLHEACEIFKEMESRYDEEYSERGGRMGRRYEDWDDMHERRGGYRSR